MNALKPLLGVVALAALIASAGCQTAPRTQARQENLEDQARVTLDRFRREDPGLTELLDRSYGHAMFPSVGKGGVIVGGAYGKGVVHEQGQMIGFADLTQATVGAQLGGQTFAELLVFQNREAMERFKNNQMTFAANASAVALRAGASAAARFEQGVAVITQPNGGLMFEASIGGQKFTFVPMEMAPGAATRPTTRPAGARPAGEEMEADDPSAAQPAGDRTIREAPARQERTIEEQTMEERRNEQRDRIDAEPQSVEERTIERRTIESPDPAQSE